MAFDDLIRGLKATEQQLAKQLAGVRAAMSALGTNGTESASTRGRRSPTNAPIRKRRRLSAKARAAISRAQKLRWAKHRAAQK